MYIQLVYPRSPIYCTIPLNVDQYQLRNLEAEFESQEQFQTVTKDAKKYAERHFI